MRLHATLLLTALTAGVAAIVAAVLAPAAHGGEVAVQYVQTIYEEMPGDGADLGPRHSIMTTASADRSRTDDDFGVYIVQCDLCRSITLRHDTKTFVETSFDEEANEVAQVRRMAEQEKTKHQNTFVNTVTDSADGETRIIDGVLAHHFVESIKAVGTGRCGVKHVTQIADVWYVPNADPFSCPSLDDRIPHNDVQLIQGDSCAYTSVVQIQGMPAHSLPLQETITTTSDGTATDAQITHVDTTSLRVIPYEPAFFAAPADFTQATPAPLPSF